jgi:hypothetical protein
MLNNRQLGTYLAWAIHGRKTEQWATTPTRRGPSRDDGYKAWIRTLPCCACGVEHRSEAAHTGSDGGMRMKASDYSCVPLCSDCHTQAPGAYHRVGKRAFEVRCGISFEGVVERLRQEWRERRAA